MKKYLFAILLLAPVVLSSCLGDDEVDYSEWEQENLEFVAQKEAETLNGVKVYQKVAPSWAPSAFSLIKWENDRSKTEKNLVPLSNSLCRVKYDLDDIDGNRISDSYSSTSYGDSIYQTRPNQNIVGFWNALTMMHVGDSVTCIMPAIAAYGNTAYGSVKPYSTLVYHIKLVSIPAYEVPMK